MTVAGRSFALIVPTALLAAAAPPADPPPPKAPKICREAEPQLGSRIRKPRRCRTAEQWQEEDQAQANLPLSAQITEGQGDALQRQRPQ